MNSFSDWTCKHLKHHNLIGVTHMVLIWLVYHFHNNATVQFWLKHWVDGI